MVQTPRKLFATLVVCVAVLAQVLYQAWKITAVKETFYLVHGVMMRLASTNQLFQMGLLTAVGYVVTIVVNFGYTSVFRPLVGSLKSSITIENKDKNFNAVVDYISDNLLVAAKGGNNSLQATTHDKKKTRRDWIKAYLGSDKKSAEDFDFRPDSNTAAYYVQYKGHTLMLERYKDKPLMGGYSETPFTPESLTVSVWGQSNDILKDLLNDALNASFKKETSNNLNIYVQSSSWWDGWELALSKKARDKTSVILDMDLLDVLLADAKRFLGAGRWYADMGVPYRRGYLLYGPPGCGKTSFAQVLAGELNLDLCILNLTAENLNDSSLALLFREAPDRSIICLEDVDSVFVERSSAGGSGGSGGGRPGQKSANVSFSGLLNAIDGVASQEGRIFFMTTNHIERLDPALVRPGRCDVQLELRRASKLQMQRMFLRFYPGAEAEAKEFSEKLPPDELSMATLQGHFLKSHGSAAACLEDTPSLLQQTRPVKQPQKTIFEHFRRAGLAKYAPIAELHGCSVAPDLARTGFTVELMEKLCIGFKFDSSARDSLKRLLADEEDFLQSSYALADMSSIREAFLTAYPTTHEKQTGEVAPYFRRTRGLTPTVVMAPGIAIDQQMKDQSPSGEKPLQPSRAVKLIRSFSSDSRSFAKTTLATIPDDDTLVLAAEKLSEQELDLLSHKFCELLSRNGKGVISLGQLRALLDAHPHRPLKCAEAAPAFVGPRQLNQYSFTDIDYYGFLKRAGCAEHLYAIKGVTTVTALLVKGSKDSVNDLAQSFEDSGFETEQARNLAEIITGTQSPSGALMRFELHPRARIIRDFKLFYTLPRPEPPKTESEAKEESKEDTKADDPSPSNVSAASPAKPKESQKTASSTPVKPVPKPSEEELERIAFSYSLAATDEFGQATVSLIEVEHHLRKHVNNPLAALASIHQELLDPPRPEPPAPRPPPPESTAWVHVWLKGGDEKLADYSATFVDEGMETKENLLLGPLFTDAELKDVYGVRKAGHRRMIIAMHTQLKEQNGQGQGQGQGQAAGASN